MLKKKLEWNKHKKEIEKTQFKNNRTIQIEQFKKTQKSEAVCSCRLKVIGKEIVPREALHGGGQDDCAVHGSRGFRRRSCWDRRADRRCGRNQAGEGRS